MEDRKNPNDPEAGYKTEIAGGVPIKIPIRVRNPCSLADPEKKGWGDFLGLQPLSPLNFQK